MRSLLISLLVVLLAAAIQAEVFKKEKVKLGKKTCLCDFNIEIGNTCSGSAKCDKKCSGSGTVELGGCSFTLAVKKGKGKISKCSCEAATVAVPTEPTTGSGSGETPIPITGSGSGETPVPITGSGSGETPVPITGSGSGETPVPITGSGSGGPPPAGGEGMQCSCKCSCPDGSGECDCDCNCPMTSKALTCAPGFSKVCPMMGDMCPQDMDPVCPYNAMSRMAGNAAYEGCQCVPDFLLDMVMIQPTARMEAVDRAMTKATIQVGKKKCKCSYEMNAENCKKSKIVCDKKCSGKATGVELADGDVMYMVDLAIKKGKVSISKCDVDAPEPTGTGGGSAGSGSGNGEGGVGGMGSRCACVSKGMGGSGPTVPTLPPTGSGSEPAPPPGSGSEPPTGSGSEPPTGSGSGSGDGANTLYRQELSDYPAAVCNDGTTATYFYSSDAFTNDNLLIYLEGGGGCNDKTSCEQRCTNPYSAHRCTTNDNNTMTLNSTFWSKDEATNPPFHEFASIWVDYCSSDTWIGSRDASSETGGYHFHGKDIVNAVIDDIIARKSNIGDLNQVVLLGTSAGAFGVQSNCDLVADKFKAEKNDLDIRCVADSGDLIPAVGYDCSTEEAANESLEFIGAELDATCTEANDEWKCVRFSSLYNFIETPLMVVHNYIDKTVSGECSPDLNPENQDYWKEWNQQVLQLSQQFMQDKPGNGLFVPNCHFHVLAKNYKAWHVIEVPLAATGDKVLLKDIIQNWLTGDGPYQAIDSNMAMNDECQF